MAFSKNCEKQKEEPSTWKKPSSTSPTEAHPFPETLTCDDFKLTGGDLRTGWWYFDIQDVQDQDWTRVIRKKLWYSSKLTLFCETVREIILEIQKELDVMVFVFIIQFISQNYCDSRIDVQWHANRGLPLQSVSCRSCQFVCFLELALRELHFYFSAAE